MEEEWIPLSAAATLMGIDRANAWQMVMTNRLTGVCFLGALVGVGQRSSGAQRRNIYILQADITPYLDCGRQLESGGWITVYEAAEIIGVTAGGVCRRVKTGRLKSWVIHKNRMFVSRSEVEAQRRTKRNPPLTPVHLTVAQAAYLAGMIDGEGCISIYHRKGPPGQNGSHFIRLAVANTHRGVIQWMQALLGGNISIRNRGNTARWKIGYVWMIGNSPACQVLSIVLPYLQVKAEQASIALAFREHILQQAVNAPKALTVEEIEWRNTQKDLMHKLNRKGA